MDILLEDCQCEINFADLQKPQVELDGKACAAVGQNGLMALYDTLFIQLDVTTSQLLVTDNNFKNTDFRVQLENMSRREDECGKRETTPPKRLPPPSR
ncbi:hypothetical protein AgCh_032156 [Apium graveolens]